MASNWRLGVWEAGLSGPGPKFGLGAIPINYVARLITPILLPTGLMTHILAYSIGPTQIMVFGRASVPGNAINVFGGFGGSGPFPGVFAVHPDN